MDLYTAWVYKRDGRTRAGERRVLARDYRAFSADALRNLMAETWPAAKGYRVEVYETMVERENAMTGETFRERFDTPRSCSPASETYWSM